MKESSKIRVMIAGIAGASLGTEIAKCLAAIDRYTVMGCDINPLAFGHHDRNFKKTFIVDDDKYLDELLNLALIEDVQILIPGGEVPAKLIGQASEMFINKGILIAQNDPGVVALASNKSANFKYLESFGIKIPRTIEVSAETPVESFPFPCIVKPSRNSGGSSFVFFARDQDETELYVSYLRRNGQIPLLQEYIPHDAGEFTVGVLSGRARQVFGSIALKRSFSSKLSVLAKGRDFVISSGYSQGRIEAFSEVCDAAVKIAKVMGSTGPLNVQGRIDREGFFVPFEINARFSASTYLRRLAGFNEVDFFLQHLIGRLPQEQLTVRSGWYLRSLSEIAV